MDKYQKVVVDGLLIKDGRALIIRRANHESFLPGYYELPSGKVEFGEDPRDAIVREFKEETNLFVKTIKPYHTFSYVMENGNRHTVEIVYLVNLADESSIIALSEDHDEYKWISPEEIDNYNITDEMKESILGGMNYPALPKPKQSAPNPPH